MPLRTLPLRPPSRARGRALRFLAVSAIALAGALPLARAQAASQSLPAFDVVSVKPFKIPPPGMRGQWHRQAVYDPQRLYIQGMYTEGLIREAYQAIPNQIVGIPNAMTRELFTITGTTDKPATEAQMRLMLQRVLAERFHLVIDDTTRVQPVYDLVVAKGGPKLQAMHSNNECTAYNAESVEELHLPPGTLYSYAGCTITDLVLRLNLPDPAMFQLDPLLPVLDKTGLTGLYRIALWQSIGPREPVPGHPGMSSPSYIEPIQEALQQELGLELVKSKGPYRVLTIKHMSDPTAN